MDFDAWFKKNEGQIPHLIFNNISLLHLLKTQDTDTEKALKMYDDQSQYLTVNSERLDDEYRNAFRKYVNTSSREPAKVGKPPRLEGENDENSGQIKAPELIRDENNNAAPIGFFWGGTRSTNLSPPSSSQRYWHSVGKGMEGSWIDFKAWNDGWFGRCLNSAPPIQ